MEVITNLQRTWSAATKAVRTSRKFVYALLALHNGYPDLMSKELFEDHLASLGNLLKHFAWQQPEFCGLSLHEQRRLIEQNTPLFIQYILSGYLKAKTGLAQIRGAIQ